MSNGFEPLFDRLLYVRHLSLMRPAIPVGEDPIKCWVAFFFTLDQTGAIVYSTDQKPTYRPKMSGRFYLTYFKPKFQFFRFTVCLLSMARGTKIVQFG